MKWKLCAGLLAIVGMTVNGAECWTWGATGHEHVSGIAIEKLPDVVPAFMRTTEAAADILRRGSGSPLNGP
jgi:hypothetical protein